MLDVEKLLVERKTKHNNQQLLNEGSQSQLAIRDISNSHALIYYPL